METDSQKSGWTVETLKEHFEKMIDGERRANDQRFSAQEKAIETAEHNRDIAINKAEASIEKKSDIAYVKISDLQRTLTELMPRLEAESRFKGLVDKIDDLKESRSESKGKGTGWIESKATLFSMVSLIGTLIAIFYALSK